MMPILMALLIGLLIYFAPTGVAINRSHPNTGAIFALNLLAGWTMIGWVGAFVWALIRQRQPVPSHYREIGPGQYVPVFELTKQEEQ